MSIAPDKVARETPPRGSDHDLALNRDYTTGAGLLTDADLSVTETGRRGVWMGHTMIVGEPARHGTVADEAAMLALHDWEDDPHTRALYHYVQVGDSVLREDDPGYYWTCIGGHGTMLSQWERRPLGDTVDDIAVDLGGKQPLASALTQLSGVDLTDVGLALLELPTPSAAKIPQINADGTVTLVDGSGGGTSLPTPTVGQMLYCAEAGTWAALPAPGVVGQVLTATESGAARIPQWVLPANQYTPRVQVWLNRIALAGGTLTDDSEDIAVAFVDAMNARSWAGKITYLLPFLGGNLAAGIVPIVDTRGVGAPINTGFANADFSESAGIQGASTKWLNTQLTVAQLGASGNGGLGIIELSLPSPAVSREEGGYADSATDRRYGLYTRTSSPWRIFWWGDPATRVESPTALAPAHIYGQRSSATDRRLYIDGVLAGTTTANDPSELAAQAPLFALGSQQGTYPDYGDPVRCGAWYATDGTLTDAEVADIYAFLQQYLITPTGR